MTNKSAIIKIRSQLAALEGYLSVYDNFEKFETPHRNVANYVKDAHRKILEIIKNFDQQFYGEKNDE